jgi:predicted negative regulator of RcsB-dependent stress response
MAPAHSSSSWTVVAGIVVYRGIEDGKRLTAGNSLYRANDAATLQKVISEHPKTPAAASAHILLAEKQWNEGQQDASIETLKSFLAASPGHPGIPFAKAALAAKLMSQGKVAEAAPAFEELADDPAFSYLAPYALLCLGDMAVAGGDKEKAKSFYDRSQSQFPSSGFNQKITQRIASIPHQLLNPLPQNPVPLQPSPCLSPPVPLLLRKSISHRGNPATNRKILPHRNNPIFQMTNPD